MELLSQTVLWGLVIGMIHFVVLGVLYNNPFVARYYKEAQENSPGVKKWPNKKDYLVKMFLGTQVEVFILTASYIFFSSALVHPLEMVDGRLLAIGLAIIFSGIRIYPRFWNMWVQSTYPNKLLAIEFVNGTISTFVVVMGLYYLIG